jgi:PhnB protein
VRSDKGTFMNKKVNYQATGYHTATPYMIMKGATQAIEFYKKAFGATEIMRIDAPGGTIGHAEIQIGDSRLMLADEAPAWDAYSPEKFGGTPVSIMIYVEDCDAVFARAISLGAKELKPVKDQFYGDRSGHLSDPFGHVWTIATHKEDLSPEEMAKRAAEVCK